MRLRTGRHSLSALTDDDYVSALLRQMNAALTEALLIEDENSGQLIVDIRPDALIYALAAILASWIARSDRGLSKDDKRAVTDDFRRQFMTLSAGYEQVLTKLAFLDIELRRHSKHGIQ